MVRTAAFQAKRPQILGAIYRHGSHHISPTFIWIATRSTALINRRSSGAIRLQEQGRWDGIQLGVILTNRQRWKSRCGLTLCKAAWMLSSSHAPRYERNSTCLPSVLAKVFAGEP